MLEERDSLLSRAAIFGYGAESWIDGCPRAYSHRCGFCEDLDRDSD